MKTIAFTGGGTGGHIYPGLAAAASLKLTAAVRIIWIGSRSPLDRSIVEGGAGTGDIEFFSIKSGKLRRYFSLKNITDLFNIIVGFFEARAILKREKPVVLFSKGGFVSVPPCAAAHSLHIPVITHESDLSPGLATRLNALFADKICVSYHETAAFFRPALQKKIVVTGNPVRDAFRTADAAKGRAFLGVPTPTDTKILLVLGGSQGAGEVNSLVRDALPFLTRHFFVAHQTGQADFAAFEPLRSDRYRPLAYIGAEMPDVVSSASLVIGRAGAGTLWESAVCGRPLVLIPLAGSGTRGDQVENARFFEKRGAAITLIHPDADTLIRTLEPLLSSPEKLEEMARAAAGIAGEAPGTVDALLSSVLFAV